MILITNFSCVFSANKKTYSTIKKLPILSCKYMLNLAVADAQGGKGNRVPQAALESANSR